MSRHRLLLTAAILLGCAPAEAQVSWVRRDPVRAVRSVPFANRELDESSGLAASRAHPGVLWTIEDSGTGPYLFATDTLGRDLGTWEVPGIENRDWEAISRGPCPAGTCLHIGDTGDNSLTRDRVTIFRIPEPDPAAASRRVRGAERLTVRYPAGAHDVEALVVTPAQDLLLVSKGGAGGAHLFRVPGAAWKSKGTATAEPLGTLPLPPGGSFVSRVTDAALAPDGRRVAVRTYADVYFFELAADGSLAPAKPPIVCSIFGLQLQGEGIDWLDARRLALSAERSFGVAGGVAIVECPDR